MFNCFTGNVNGPTCVESCVPLVIFLHHGSNASLHRKASHVGALQPPAMSVPDMECIPRSAAVPEVCQFCCDILPEVTLQCHPKHIMCWDCADRQHRETGDGDVLLVCPMCRQNVYVQPTPLPGAREATLPLPVTKCDVSEESPHDEDMPNEDWGDEDWGSEEPHPPPQTLFTESPASYGMRPEYRNTLPAPSSSDPYLRRCDSETEIQYVHRLAERYTLSRYGPKLFPTPESGKFCTVCNGLVEHDTRHIGRCWSWRLRPT